MHDADDLDPSSAGVDDRAAERVPAEVALPGFFVDEADATRVRLEILREQAAGDRPNVHRHEIPGRDDVRVKDGAQQLRPHANAKYSRPGPTERRGALIGV